MMGKPKFYIAKKNTVTEYTLCTNCNRIWQHSLLNVCCFTHICKFNLQVRETDIYYYYYTLSFLHSS
jgi:hypothetical protein